MRNECLYVFLSHCLSYPWGDIYRVTNIKVLPWLLRRPGGILGSRCLLVDSIRLLIRRHDPARRTNVSCWLGPQWMIQFLRDARRTNLDRCRCLRSQWMTSFVVEDHNGWPIKYVVCLNFVYLKLNTWITQLLTRILDNYYDKSRDKKRRQESKTRISEFLLFLEFIMLG
jgi:hypothetical protein